MNVGVVANAGIDPGTNGNYFVGSNAAEVLSLVRPGVTTLITAGTSLQVDTWENIKLTRTNSGRFDLFLNNVNQGNATDAAITSANWLSFFMLSGGKMAYSDLRGDHSIIKRLTV